MEEKTVEPVLKDMTINSAIAVRMNIMVILIVITVNASQATLWMLLMFAIKKMAPAHVPRVTLVDNVMFVKMGTLVIPPAKVCTVSFLESVHFSWILSPFPRCSSKQMQDASDAPLLSPLLLPLRAPLLNAATLLSSLLLHL